MCRIAYAQQSEAAWKNFKFLLLLEATLLMTRGCDIDWAPHFAAAEAASNAADAGVSAGAEGAVMQVLDTAGAHDNGDSPADSVADEGTET